MATPMATAKFRGPLRTSAARSCAMPTMPYDPTGASLLTPALHAPLFRADHAYDSVQLGAECARLAYLKAESDAAAHAQLTEALARVGFGAPRLFRSVETGTEGYGALRAADGLGLLALRGTEATTLTDLVTDIAFLLSLIHI